jgi:flavodoxin
VKTVIYCASRSGNTRAIAQAIADGIRPHGVAIVRDIDGAHPELPIDADLVLVGGPTEGHGPTPAVLQFLEGIPEGSMANRAVAAFDTRLDWPRWASGSAATGVTKQLQSLGARIVSRPASFLVSMKPELLPGELDRARAWGTELTGVMSAEQSIPATAAS